MWEVLGFVSVKLHGWSDGNPDLRILYNTTVNHARGVRSSSFLATNLKPNVKVANYLGKLAVTIVEQGKRS